MSNERYRPGVDFRLLDGSQGRPSLDCQAGLDGFQQNSGLGFICYQVASKASEKGPFFGLDKEAKSSRWMSNGMIELTLIPVHLLL